MDFNDINRDDSHIYNTKKISSLHIHSDIYTGAYLREIQAQSALLSPVIQAQTHILVATRSTGWLRQKNHSFDLYQYTDQSDKICEVYENHKQA